MNAKRSPVPALVKASADLGTCVDCGSTTGPYSPTGGYLDGAQLFRCSTGCQPTVDRFITVPLRRGGFYTAECPEWCTKDHADDIEWGVTSPADLVHEGDPEAAWTSWQSMTMGAVKATPVADLMRLLGVRLVEVAPGELAAENIKGYMSGPVGDAEIQVERTLPQAEREQVVRELLGQIDLTDQPHAIRATPLPRLVPAKVDGNLVHIECPEWCTYDHAAGAELFLEDVYHSSDSVSLMVPRMGGQAEPLVHVRINADTFGTVPEHVTPHIVIDDETGGSYMTPDQADELADSLVAFADEVRALAAQIAR